jgi:hypothetical protein
MQAPPDHWPAPAPQSPHAPHPVTVSSPAEDVPWGVNVAGLFRSEMVICINPEDLPSFLQDAG